MSLGRPELGEDNRQDARAGFLASLGFVGALSLSSLGCTDGPNTDSSTTDNTTMSGDGDGDGDTSENPCIGLEVDPGIAEVTLSPGEGGTANVEDPSSPHYGASLAIPEGATIFPSDARVLIYEAISQNAPQGFNTVGKNGPLQITAVYAHQQMIDKDGVCVPNVITPAQADMSLPGKQPTLTSAEGLYGTAFEVDQDGSFTMLPDSELTEDGAHTKIDHLGAYGFYNSVPNVSAQANVDVNSQLTVDITGTTDEGEMPEGLAVTVDGRQAIQDPNNQNLWHIEGPFAPGVQSLSIGVIGLNGVEGGDVSTAQVEFEMCAEGSVKEGDECVDVTPPGTPVIETNEGQPLGVFENNVALQGNCAPDVNSMEYKVNDGAWNVMPNYSAGSTSWEVNVPLPTIDLYEICVRAKDEAENVSEEDCMSVERLS